MNHPQSNGNRSPANPSILEQQALKRRVRRVPGFYPFGQRALQPGYRSLVMVVGLMLTASACAADGPRIERIDSPTLRIAEVDVEQRDGFLQVRGILKKHPPGRVAQRRAGRFPIRGHLHLLAISADAHVLACETTDDFGRSARRGVETFSETLAVPAQVPRLRLIYHEADDQTPVDSQC